MSNAQGVGASREEEIAFLVMESVLDVDIRLADAGAGDKMPDGCWVCPEQPNHRAIVEITSPPATERMKEWAQAKRHGKPLTECETIPLHLNQLALACTQLLKEDWAAENIAKLVARPADERHLFLFARSIESGDSYFERLSDLREDGTFEHVDDILLPEDITDVWFLGRGQRDHPLGTTEVRVARSQAGSGWARHVVRFEEQQLPSPNPGFTDDNAPPNWRRPKDRTMQTC